MTSDYPSDEDFAATLDSAIGQARTLIEQAPIFLDTETTGLSEKAEIVEIAIIDQDGSVLFDSVIKPKGKIPNEATEIHGITDAAVKNAPAWCEVHDRVFDIIKNRQVVIYNSSFDLRMLKQTAEKYQLTVPEIDATCLMRLYARFNGDWSDYHGGWAWVKLTAAARACGFDIDSITAHRALADCYMARQVLGWIAGSAEPQIECDPDIPF